MRQGIGPDHNLARQGGRRRLALGAATAGLLLAGLTGTAYAVSAGGYQPYQQGCQPYDSDWNTPTGEVYPGCHDVALNVESGGTHQGNPDDANTKYVQFGLDQEPVDPRSQGTPTPYSLGYPGQSASPHAACLAVNTDGTGGHPAAPGRAPTSAGQAYDSPGCGGNPRGVGFASQVDYYQFYCPVAALIGDPCEATSYGTTTVIPELGRQVAYQPVVEHGLLVYYGMDDNTDNGEHDGVGPYTNQVNPNDGGAANGASDGGGIMLLIDPLGAGAFPSATKPEGLANASFGECADGICSEGTTERQAVYHGCGAADSAGQAPCAAGTPTNANVYDYAPGGDPAHDPSVNGEPAGCNSGDATTTSAAACGPGGMNYWRSQTPANEWAEPGLQVYSDPDPQRSPAAPAPLWPTPGLYVGTCGVYAGSPATTGMVLGSTPLSLGPIPVTDRAGQVAVDLQPGTC
jgi:hypothetical protein